MENLKQLKEKYLNAELSAEEVLKVVFDTYLLEAVIPEKNLTISYVGYGLYQLRQNGEFLNEGELTDCQEEAYKILNN